MRDYKKVYTFRAAPDVYYVWVGGSCDYANEERAGGGAYIIEKENKRYDEYFISEMHTTEFRMLFKVMLHAMREIPTESKICFLTNVAYLQNFDKEPTAATANADLIVQCITAKARHKECYVKIIPYHKFSQLPETHNVAHNAMIEQRNHKNG